VSPTIPPPRESGFTSTTPRPLYWAAYGERGAPRLLLLHGGPGAHHDYLLPQMLHLAREHELLFYDQRGGGRSKHDDDREVITWRTQVEDLARVIAELGVGGQDEGGPSIVGYSWGALLAMLYAVEATAAADAGPTTSAQPDSPLPRRLLLLDPAPVTREHRRRFEDEFARRQQAGEIQTMREELSASGLRERDPAAFRQRQFELGVAGYFADPRRARDLTPFRVTGRVQQSIWESLGDFDLTAGLARVRGAGVPSMIVHGRQDPIPVASSEAAARALGAELVLLDDCGHVPYVEQPDGLWAAADRFLAETRDHPASRPPR
jgi:proline iminopeptidase